ncbi:MAG: RNA polymerase sigma-70 factor [Bacteroidales bacterium]|nr:RNA polymerase sigma-70 factor [Bacteroidales bacterium]MDD3989265.1 RNA polymerase sigma-70 factor [Bacteroidales bacterium]MDD4639090.1 RNA polymerase sigma-70 factor [Bacteroidales bacterium]
MTGDLLTLIRIREGSIEAFEELFRSFYSPLLFFSMSITRREDVSEEIVQEIFYQIWKNRERLTVITSLKSYLYGAVKNRSLQYNQRERAREGGKPESITGIPASGNSDPQNQMEFAELEEIVERTLAKMPERRARIFLMHREGNIKYQDIAKALSLSVKSVEAEITKALKMLRKEIEIYTAPR